MVSITLGTQGYSVVERTKREKQLCAKRDRKTRKEEEPGMLEKDRFQNNVERHGQQRRSYCPALFQGTNGIHSWPIDRSISWLALFTLIYLERDDCDFVLCRAIIVGSRTMNGTLNVFMLSDFGNFAPFRPIGWRCSKSETISDFFKPEMFRTLRVSPTVARGSTNSLNDSTDPTSKYISNIKILIFNTDV